MQFQRKGAKVIISQILFGWHKKFKKREVQHSKENAHTKHDTSTEDDNDTMMVDT